MTNNPYATLPDRAFWSRSVAIARPSDVDPVGTPPFVVSKNSGIAAAGSCFAQHIAQAIVSAGYNYVITESGPPERNFGVYSARFGNIYSTRQFLQLFDRAYGMFDSARDVWIRPDGAFVDPFRPQVEPNGFPSIVAVEADRRQHLASVRRMFESCDVFIFTLGLTEVWRSVADGAVVPLAPGVVAESALGVKYEFANLSVPEMIEDLRTIIKSVRTFNPEFRMILTVSPVPLVATYEPRHVLLSTIYSKSALRVVAEVVSQGVDDVTYFPSYEIISGHHNRYAYFGPDLRSVSAEGVAHVMRLFKQHYMSSDTETTPRASGFQITGTALHDGVVEQRLRQLSEVLCDEELLDASQ